MKVMSVFSHFLLLPVIIACWIFSLLHYVFGVYVNLEPRFIVLLKGKVCGMVVLAWAKINILKQNYYISDLGLYIENDAEVRLIAEWCEVDFIERVFNAPFFFYYVVLKNGRKVELQQPDILEVAKRNSVTVREH